MCVCTKDKASSQTDHFCPLCCPCSEIEKFGEIEEEPDLDDFDDNYEEVEGSSSPSPEADSIQLNQKIEHLQYKLEEALAAISSRESKVLELEANLNRSGLPKKETENTDLPLLKEKCEEMEFELESLLEKKIEAEIEYLIMTRATQGWKVLAEDHIALLEDQNSLAGDQLQIMHKLRDTENKAMMLKGQMEELEAYCTELVGIEEVLQLHNKVFESSLRCFVQLVMLFITFWLLLMQLLPQASGVVPT